MSGDLDRLDQEAYASLRDMASRQARTLMEISDYVNGDDVREDPVAIAVKTILYPPRVCDQCGQLDSVAFGAPCSCWSEVGPDDLTALQAMGVEVRDDEEEDR